MDRISIMLDIYNQSIPFLKTDLKNFSEKLNFGNGSLYFIEEVDSIPVGFAIVNQNSILALCVSPQYQNRGIGRKLLHKAEKYIFEQGYRNIVLGLSNQTYLLQGVPYNDDYNSVGFFKKHGYSANWSSIDMVLPLKDFTLDKIKIPAVSTDISTDIRFCYAGKRDKEFLLKKVHRVNPSWCVYYSRTEDAIYLAEEDNEIIGFVMLCDDNMPFAVNFDGKVGGLGCLGVVPEKRNRGVGLQLVARGTYELKRLGCDYSYISYTWLEHWYGSLGYRRYASFWMGEKSVHQ